MSIRYALRTLLKRTAPLVYASGYLFTDYKQPEKPNPDKKLMLDLPDAGTLSYEYMIKQCALEAVNKATQMLTVTYAAITDATKEYRNLLTELIILLEETSTTEVSDAHWDRIVTVRVEMQTKKEAVNKLHNYMTYVHNMGVTTSELCYLTGMEQLSESLYQRLTAAVQDLKKEVGITEELEKDYYKVQEECIKSEKKNYFLHWVARKYLKPEKMNKKLHEIANGRKTKIISKCKNKNNEWFVKYKGNIRLK